MNRTLLTIIMLTASACTWKGADSDADAGADTAIGDDDGGDGTGGPFEDPPPVEGHGIEQYCVDRALWISNEFGPDADVNHLDINSNEHWWPTLARSYGGWLDITDKPSPAAVPIVMPPNWPLAQLYIDDAAERGGEATGLVSGYHLQFPVPGASGLLDPGIVTLPYSVDVIAESVWAGSAFRHSWMAPGCCNYPLTDGELDAEVWSSLAYPHELLGNPDCIAYVMAAGVNDDAAGYPRSVVSGKLTIAQASRCVTGGGSYNAGNGTAYGPAASLADMMSLFSQLNDAEVRDNFGKVGTAHANQIPMLFNYEWASQLAALADWQAVVGDALVWTGSAYILSKLNISVNAAVTAILWIANNLYLPPDDVVHARYGAGGGCSFPAHVYLDEEDTNSWWASWTCPVGYYAAFPQFSHVAPGPRADGVTGTCRLDGADAAPLVQPLDSILVPSGTGKDTFVVVDVDAFASAVGELEIVTPEFAALIEQANTERAIAYSRIGVVFDPDILPAIAAGDMIAWSPSPGGVPMSRADAISRTLGYDMPALEELARALGWSIDDVIGWLDVQPLGTVGDLLGARALDVPADLLDRTTVSLRKQTWHLRIESSDGVVTFLHFGA